MIKTDFSARLGRGSLAFSLRAGLALSVWVSAAFGAVAGVGGATAAAAAEPGPHAVVIMYHRFGEEDLPSTNIRMDQFEAHLKELQSGKYTVWALPKIINALRSGESVPDRVVGISVDDAFLSVYTRAFPLLKEAGLPWTLFIATNPIDRKLVDYANWDQIREMKAAGVTIGSQTHTHPHMAANSRAANVNDLEVSNRRFLEELGERPTLIAYPYGEGGVEVWDIAKEQGFEAGLGQHSGVMHPGSNFFYLPRFAMNEAYGDLDRFRMAANALPIPLSDVVPDDVVIRESANPPLAGFTISTPIRGLDTLACYASHQGKVRLERLGDERFELRFDKPMPKGRTRLNCTMPAGDGRWRWAGRQFYRPGADD